MNEYITYRISESEIIGLCAKYGKKTGFRKVHRTGKEQREYDNAEEDG